jgi:hypothetical protein
MRGKLPATLEGLPEGVREVSVQTTDEDQVVQVPSTTTGEPLQWPMGLLAQSQVQDEFIDSIVDRPDLKPSPREPEDRQPVPIPPEGLTWTAGQLIATSAVSSILLILGLQYGLPLLLQAIRQMRKSRGQTLLTDDQFQQLLNQYQQLIKLLEQNTKPSSTGPDSVDRVR